MGTRADFYIGRGPEAEWLGSIAYDGYPDGIETTILDATTPKKFRAAVAKFLKERDDSTFPDQGWPWPWEDSRTTDYAYAFDGGAVLASRMGHQWAATGDVDNGDGPKMGPEAFPNMKSRQNVRLDRGSGVMILALPRK